MITSHEVRVLTLNPYYVVRIYGNMIKSYLVTNLVLLFFLTNQLFLYLDIYLIFGRENFFLTFFFFILDKQKKEENHA